MNSPPTRSGFVSPRRINLPLSGGGMKRLRFTFPRPEKGEDASAISASRWGSNCGYDLNATYFRFYVAAACREGFDASRRAKTPVTMLKAAAVDSQIAGEARLPVTPIRNVAIAGVNVPNRPFARLKMIA